MQRLHHDETARDPRLGDLDQIVRQGARQMLAEALEAEVREYLDAARGERDEQGHALVVRNGHANEREVTLGAGSVTLKTPRINDTPVERMAADRGSRA